MAELHVMDYIVLASAIFFSFSIGIFFACHKMNDTTESYLLANRQMRVLPVTASFLVTFISSISLLGNSSEMYYYGSSYIFTLIGWAASLLFMSVTIVPMLYPLKLVSIHEYFLLRYRTKGAMYLATICQNLVQCFFSGIVIFGPATMLESMAGIPAWAGMLVLGTVTTIYTTLGGFTAVIWTDAFQALVMFAGLLLINIVGTVRTGGVSEVWTIYNQQGRLQPNWDPSPFVRSTVWGFVIGMFVSVINFMGVTQMAMQRCSSLPDLKKAQRAVWYAIPLTMVMLALTCTSGVVAFSYYAKLGCDPMSSGQITNKNQILPYFVLEVLNYPGIPGLFMACIVCASFSTLSSTYNCVAAMIWEDVLKDLLAARHLTEQRKALVTKIISGVMGVVSIISGFLISQLGGTLIQISLSISATGSVPVTILMILGAVFWRVSFRAAVIAALLPSVFIGWVNFGSNHSGYVQKHLPVVTANCSQDIPGQNITSLNSSLAVNVTDLSLEGSDKLEKPCTS